MLQIDSSHPFADFRNFLWRVWNHLNLPDPTPVQYDIAQFLQHGEKRIIIEAFRGVGKSWITSAFVLWTLYWNRDAKILVVSASKERADAFSQFTLRLIYDMPELQEMIPKPGQRRSLISFDVAGAKVDHSPSVKSVGITGQLAGSRADLIIADDVEVPKNSQTQMQREKLQEAVKEFDAILKPLPTSRIVYLGTPQCEDSLYNVLGQRGYVQRIWPARMPTEMEIADYEGRLAEFILNMDLEPGQPTDPKRFGLGDLTEREASYGRSGFAMQFMLQTKLSDAIKFPLRCSDFMVMDVDKEVAPLRVTYGSGPDQEMDLGCVGFRGDRWYRPLFISDQVSEYQSSVMFVDPAGRGMDRTAVVVVKMLNGFLYVRRAVSLEGGYDDTTLTAIARMAQFEKVNLIKVESNFGDGMFNELLKPYLKRIYPCALEEVKSYSQKEKRIIECLEPVLVSHRLIVDKTIVLADVSLPVEHQLFHQLTRLTKDKNSLPHDDLIDALAGAVEHFRDAMEMDASSAEKDARDQAMDEEIAKLMDSIGNGWRPSRLRPSYIDVV